MDTLLLVIIIAAVVALAAIVALAVALWRGRRSQHLRDRFGPEYDYTVHRLGDRRRAEAELATREKQAKSLELRPLSSSESERFAEAWQSVQTRFVDEPVGAIVDADLLVSDVMEARGYPDGDFEGRTAVRPYLYPA